MEGINQQIKRQPILKKLVWGVIILCISVGVALLSINKLVPAILIMSLPFVLVFLGIIFYTPRNGIIALLLANYLAMGLARYIPAPLGLSVDGLLVLTWLSLIFSLFNKKIAWKKAWNGFTIAAIVWFLYALFQLVNPEAVSKVAWFYAMRGVALYMFLAVPLTFLVFNREVDLNFFLKLWAWLTLLGVAKGAMQLFVGPDPWEKQWLDLIGGKTHLLPGGLRVFSFFTDAATYGGSMGMSGVVFSIIALTCENRKEKLFYGFVGMAAFYALLISGTRGAMAVPFAGVTLYALLSKKFKIIITGLIVIGGLYGFLKFTNIGNGVYEIRRFRTALDPDNPSLMVRKDNQKLLKNYLGTRPFGGGLGSAGNWGLRFSPGTFLAETPTDSWYVQIWAEQGRVGLTLHLFILFFLVIRCSIIIMLKLQSQRLKGVAMAFLSGMFGVMAASYGSGALGQMPNGIIIYMSVAFIFMMPEWEKSAQIRGKDEDFTIIS